MTTNALPENRDNRLPAGMDDCLSKPVEPLIGVLEQSTAAPEEGSPATNFQLLIESGIADMLPQLITTFVKSASDSIEKASAALRTSRAADLAEAAHSLKGSCSYMGATRLYDLCQKLESLGRAGSLQGAPELFAVVQREFARVKAELIAYRDQGITRGAQGS